MEAAVDLHIHTALSPCSEEEMSPNNIVNMSLLKGLDIIAVTDHNSAENVCSVMECAKGSSLLVVPGMELETMEEVHLVCLFESSDKALQMQEIVYSKLPPINNRVEIFGEQIIYDHDDNVTGKCDKLLQTAAGIGVDEAFDIVKGLGGAIIPAHIDRESYSMMSNLGSIPDNLSIRYLEISTMCPREKYLKITSRLNQYKFISSSDAHRLGDILERVSFIELEELSAKCLINKFRYG